MATCNDIDSSLASLRASNDAKLAAMQAKIDGCCAKTDDALAKAIEAINSIAGLIKSVNDFCHIRIRDFLYANCQCLQEAWSLP